MTELLLLLAAMILVAFCGGFVAAEFALVTVNRANVETEAATGDKRSVGVLKALRSLSTQLSGAQLGITITNLAIGFLAEPAIAQLLQSPLAGFGLSANAVDSIAVTIALVIATAVTMIFGELIPKNLALSKPREVARTMQGPQRAFTTIMAWPIRLFNNTANTILRVMGIEPQEELASARSAEELTALVRHSADEGTLDAETAHLLERSLLFGERRAHDVMTARPQVKALDPQDTAAAVIELARETGYSRFPVIEELDETTDRVVGVAHLRRALGVAYVDRAATLIGTIMSAPVVVPDTVELDELMDQLRDGGLQMAVLIDEFGSIAGLVTLEDLVEELVGEVQDEHDDEHAATASADGTWTTPGLLRPDEASQIIGATIPEGDDYETLGGLITVELGRFPEVGDLVTIEGPSFDDHRAQLIHLETLSIDDHRVDSVRISVEDKPDEYDNDHQDEHEDEHQHERDGDET